MLNLDDRDARLEDPLPCHGYSTSLIPSCPAYGTLLNYWPCWANVKVGKRRFESRGPRWGWSASRSASRDGSGGSSRKRRTYYRPLRGRIPTRGNLFRTQVTGPPSFAAAFGWVKRCFGGGGLVCCEALCFQFSLARHAFFERIGFHRNAFLAEHHLSQEAETELH